MIVYVFGNPLVEEDSLPLKILSRLREEFSNIVFEELDSSETFPKQKELIILDTVKGLKKVEILTDIDKFVEHKPYSLHDFDLGLNLKLMKKMKMIEKVKIIGIPPELNEKDAFDQVSSVIRASLFSKSG